jgi:predicted methyltransferase
MFGECGRRVVPAMFGPLVLFVVVTNIEAQPAPDYAALLAAADRSDADREADKRRNPAPFLAFADVRPGMKVLDVGAGGGYSTELIARPSHRVASFTGRILWICRRDQRLSSKYD